MPPTCKMVRGKSRNSQMLVAWRHAHLFAWLPSWGSHSLGATLRFRRHGGWTHYRLVLCQRNAFDMGQWQRKAPTRYGRFVVRRSLTLFEITRWRTEPGTSGRVGLKQYVRLKVSPGGREVT